MRPRLVVPLLCATILLFCGYFPVCACGGRCCACLAASYKRVTRASAAQFNITVSASNLVSSKTFNVTAQISPGTS